MSELLPDQDPLSIPQIVAAKGRERIAMMTAYDAPDGGAARRGRRGRPARRRLGRDGDLRRAEHADRDDGLDDPPHARRRARRPKRAVVVGDMPFLSYQAEPARAVENAGRFLAEGGAAAVKLEGGRRILPAVEAILAADIPVMGHVGLTPQSYRKFGGFKVQGREADSARADPRGRAGAGARPAASRSCSSASRTRSPTEITREIADPDARHRRRRRLRRPGARLPRRRGPDARPAAEVRAALRRPRRRSSRAPRARSRRTSRAARSRPRRSRSPAIKPTLRRVH